MFLHRQLMIANALKKSGAYISYPGLIAAWDNQKEGKNNQHPDRDWARDLTGHGHDIKWINSAYNEEGSGYKDGAMWFDGVDDYGINENMPILTDYTIIVKRIFNDKNIGYSGTICAKGTNPEKLGAFVFERNDNTYFSQITFGNSYRYAVDKNIEVSWQNTTSYIGSTMEKGTLADESIITFGTAFSKIKFFKGAIYSAYLFDRSLDEQEIKAFVRKYIDPEYILPSEQA